VKNARRRAREIALQALYAWQLGGGDAAEALEQARGFEGYARADTAFVEALATRMKEGGLEVRGVATSLATESLARGLGIPLVEMSEVDSIDVTFDGADEVDPALDVIKGYGAALVREKIVAAASKKFICVCDASKLVDVLGKFPLPIEVIPMARSSVARQLVALGGQPKLREGFTTDNGNIIIDVHGLNIMNPVELESTLDHIAGVVTNGLFARRAADVLLLGTADGVKKMTV